MKNLFKLLTAIAVIVCLIGIVTPCAFAGDLQYNTNPQTGDSDLILNHKWVAAATASSNLYVNITSATTTTVKSGSGILDRIVINTGASTTTATIYDNTAGSSTKIGTLTTTAVGTIIYNCHFSTGLTIVTSGAADITVVYR